MFLTLRTLVLCILVIGSAAVAEEDKELVEVRRLAEQGNAEFQTILGRLYLSENDAEAARWFRKAAEQGHAEAQTILGAMYQIGQGVAEEGRDNHWNEKLR